MAFQKFVSKFWTQNVGGEKNPSMGESLLQSIHPPPGKRLLCINQFSEEKDYFGEKLLNNTDSNKN